MQTTGKIHFIYPEQVISDNFKKREFILEVSENPQYPQYVIFQFIKDKCSLLDQFTVGQIVEIEFNLNGKIVDYHGTNRCFNCLQAWKIKLSQ
jgi:hypothetical protein